MNNMPLWEVVKIMVVTARIITVHRSFSYICHVVPICTTVHGSLGP